LLVFVKIVADRRGKASSRLEVRDESLSESTDNIDAESLFIISSLLGGSCGRSRMSFGGS
jgi:hypothetical protein